MVQFSGAGRFVWNKCLAMSLSRLESKQRILWYEEMAFWLTLWRSSEDYGFLKSVHSQILQQKLKDLDRAFKDGFDKNQPLKRMPAFKRKSVSDSFRYPQGFKLAADKHQIYLPKIGWVKYFNSQKIVGTPKNVTVSRGGKHWFVSVQVEIETAKPQHPSKSMIGLDLGIKRFVTFSDGTAISPLNHFRKWEKKLAFLQRGLSRKEKCSANWRKQKQKVSRQHEKIARGRQDFLHKVSTQISKNHAMIVIEDLKVRNMSASATGTLEQPGVNVRAKSGLNKSILDQGWASFVSMLEYKQEWRGGEVLKVPPHHTSQTCPVCSHVSPENRRSQSEFECTACHYRENADFVGALNVLARGHRVLACGELALATL
jgi:IS605 OrfB family transposase